MAKNRLATAVALAEGRLTTNAVAADIGQYIDINAHASALALKNLSLEICHKKGELSRQIADSITCTEKQVLETKYELARQACEYNGSTEIHIIESKCALERRAAYNRASFELYAHKNREAIQRQLAECRCEIKEKIAGTNELIREIDSNRIRDALNDAKQDNLFLRLAQQSKCGCGNGNRLRA